MFNISDFYMPTGKYFAKTKININFIMSTGWKEKKPKSNQLFAPCEIFPKTTSKSKTKEKNKNKKTNTFVRFKNRKSISEKTKNTTREITTQIICLSKKSIAPSSGVKDFMVTSPASTIGKRKATSNQSIPLEIFFTEFGIFDYYSLAEKISYIGIISFSTTSPGSASGQVKLTSTP